MVRRFKTSSDIGGVRIGNDDFQVVIPNSYGDGISEVVIYDIFDKEIKFEYPFPNYHGSIKGENMNIYYEDCFNAGNEVVVATISGEYMVQSKNGVVYLEDMDRELFKRFCKERKENGE